MKKLYLLGYILALFVGINSVFAETEAADECLYDDKVSLKFQEGGVTIVPKTNLNELYDNFFVKYDLTYDKNEAEPTQHLTQTYSSIYGMCPERVYYCTLEKVTFLPNPIETLDDLFNSNGISFKEAIKMFGVFRYEKKIFLYSTKEEAEKEDELNKYNEGVNGAGFTWLEDMKKVYTSEGDGFFKDLVNAWKNTLSGDTIETTKAVKHCYNIEYKGDKPVYNLACPTLSDFFNKYNNLIQEYKSCSDKNDPTSGCKSIKITALNEKETELRNYCNTILENYDYDAGTEQDCIRDCLKLSETLVLIKTKAGLINSQNGECGFSIRLASWGLNIMKWVKYIVPVFVIIFGIFDFIKAIGADKEDEMKKSQKKFITRLIAAALIFIIPFILEFVLDKFGFTEYIDGCGVIEEIG